MPSSRSSPSLNLSTWFLILTPKKKRFLFLIFQDVPRRTQTCSSQTRLPGMWEGKTKGHRKCFLGSMFTHWQRTICLYRDLRIVLRLSKAWRIYPSECYCTVTFEQKKKGIQRDERESEQSIKSNINFSVIMCRKRFAWESLRVMDSFCVGLVRAREFKGISSEIGLRVS